MKLDKLSRLLSAFNQVAPQTQPNQIEEDKAAASAGSENSEAVRLADQFGNTSEAAIQAHKAKLTRIASEVKSGTYHPDSREVAKALIRDLIA